MLQCRTRVADMVATVLMFVFWYCHKRGREVRLAKEAEGGALEDGEVEDEDDGKSFEGSDDEEEYEEDDEAANEELSKQIDEKAKLLSQPEPSEVPLPASDQKTDAAT
jgi:hypothetical protein